MQACGVIQRLSVDLQRHDELIKIVDATVALADEQDALSDEECARDGQQQGGGQKQNQQQRTGDVKNGSAISAESRSSISVSRGLSGVDHAAMMMGYGNSDDDGMASRMLAAYAHDLLQGNGHSARGSMGSSRTSSGRHSGRQRGGGEGEGGGTDGVAFTSTRHACEKVDHAGAVVGLIRTTPKPTKAQVLVRTSE
jgi:hypothetical protein